MRKISKKFTWKKVKQMQDLAHSMKKISLFLYSLKKKSKNLLIFYLSLYLHKTKKYQTVFIYFSTFYKISSVFFYIQLIFVFHLQKDFYIVLNYIFIIRKMFIWFASIFLLSSFFLSGRPWYISQVFVRPFSVCFAFLFLCW